MERCDPFGFPKPQEKSSHDQDPCRRGDSIARPQRIRARAVDNYRRPCRDGACNRRADADAPSSPPPSSSPSPSHAPHGARGRPGSGGSAISRTAAQRLRLEVKQNIQLSGQPFVRRAFLFRNSEATSSFETPRSRCGPWGLGGPGGGLEDHASVFLPRPLARLDLDARPLDQAHHRPPQCAHVLLREFHAMEDVA